MSGNLPSGPTGPTLDDQLGDVERAQKRNAGIDTGTDVSLSMTSDTGGAPSAFEDTTVSASFGTSDGSEGQSQEPTFNAREHAFRSADFQSQTGGFFGILERGPNALNEFAQNKTLFTLVTQMSRAAANYGQRS